ncbi:hypothetical protein G6F43_010955 [Rhizopus delemar]|nr:hypothetical protein G6F43_010955 [Rhizopus delemar]
MEDRTIVILYGSETGCAQDIAENLSRQARRRQFRTRVFAMDDYDKSLLVEEKIVIFVCSTSGQGSEPTNMKKFWRFLLRKNLPQDILSDLDCAVIGLGDSSYRNFNYPSKKLYKRLLQLGANMLIERGDCDDQHYLGVDGAFIPWAKQLWEIIMKKYPTDLPILSDTVLLPPTYRAEWLSDSPSESDTRIEGFDMTVVQNTRITATDHFQEVRHLAFSCPAHYQPGDIAVMMPQNVREDVDLFLEQMGWSEYADQYIRFVPEEAHGVPLTMRFRDLFIRHLDIFGVPRRSFFEVLSYFTKDENLTERLREFASPEGQEDMWAYCMRPKRTIAEVLFDFKPVEIPFDYLLDLFPQLKPRSFSIASSLSVHPHQLELCVAIVKYKTKLRKVRRGVMTKWLATLNPGDTVSGVKIMKGTMNLPPSLDIPLIAIGPGTGIAPMKSFIEERIALGALENYLFFGCRYHDKDFHYRKLWESYQDKGLLKVFTACSRDQEEKVYVQDRILEQSSLLWDLIDQKGAKVVLSGNADKMPDQVAYAFKQVFMKEGKLSAKESEDYFDLMVKTGQYQEECWS